MPLHQYRSRVRRLYDGPAGAMLMLASLVSLHQPLIGRYTATVALHRGYSSSLDEQTVIFWVIPWKMIAAALGALIVVLLASRVLAGMFERITSTPLR